MFVSNDKNSLIQHEKLIYIKDTKGLLSYFDRPNYEKFEPQELHALVGSARKSYTEVVKEKKVLQSRKRKYAEELRDEIGVFKRKTSNQVLKDLNSVSNEILDQERKLEELKEKKKQLEASRNELYL